MLKHISCKVYKCKYVLKLAWISLDAVRSYFPQDTSRHKVIDSLRYDLKLRVVGISIHMKSSCELFFHVNEKYMKISQS